ncbi:PREDICTED: gibberellin-regulated protein 9 isoform X2 [Tarenaya hassleriana]|uniref:gibberellin-regulated protein 9 isoform X2 n=1 Tax=Tarenaya hassleriana TaxID=28532 RepID=UPI00053C8B61|nr:PREDICTED: gibberellin-regulated protein 9 isoform X2 [Tarenaya hassleriana]
MKMKKKQSNNRGISLQVLAEASFHSDLGSPTNEEDQTAAFGRRTHRPTFKCGKACERRCRESSRKKVCYRACGTCCLRCGCVPPGTSGHTNTCPCYASLRTHANKPKCP